MEVQILWSDQDVLAVYKPAGVPVQPDPTGDPDLLSSLLTACNERSIALVLRFDRPERTGIRVHLEPDERETLLE